MPSDATYNVGAENEADYPSAIIFKNSGHLRVTVSEKDVTVDYIRAYLPQDETPDHPNGEVAYSYTIKATNTSIPSKQSLINLPKEFKLNQNYPNPFNPTTHITFQIPDEVCMTLKIYNSLGQLVRTILDSKLNAGEYTVPWDGLDEYFQQVGSGIYFFELKSDEFRELRKALLIR